MTTTLPRTRKKRTIPTHYSLFPPRPLSQEKIARLQLQGIEVLTLVCPMLPSVNEKGRMGNRQWYISDAYREKEHVFQAEVTRQVLAARWTISNKDVYAIYYGLSFENETRQDYDNPIKSTQDKLQPPKPTEEEWWTLIDEKKYQQWLRDHPPIKNDRGKYKQPKPTVRQLPKLANEQLLAVWRAKHPGAIRNDGQIMKAEQTKHINQKDPRICVITILKMTYETYITYAREEPVERFADTFLAHE